MVYLINLSAVGVLLTGSPSDTSKLQWVVPLLPANHEVSANSAGTLCMRTVQCAVHIVYVQLYSTVHSVKCTEYSEQVIVCSAQCRV